MRWVVVLALVVIPSEGPQAPSRGIAGLPVEGQTPRSGRLRFLDSGAADAAPPLGMTVITIRASGSTLEFQPPTISVKNGTRVTLRFVNDGTLPHNLALPHDENDIDALATAAYQAGETGYVPLEQKDKLIAYTALASPGQTVEATFTVPPPGEYTYVCLFPGHANSMLGTLRSLR